MSGTMSMEEWVKRVDKLAQGGLQKLLKREMQKAGLLGVRAAKTKATGSPKVRSGRLRGSIRHAIREGSGGAAELVLMAGGGEVTGGGITLGGVNYAKLQEYGGTVTPKRGKYLAIPLPPVLTRAGVPRWNGPRNSPDELAFAQSLKGQPLLVNRETGEPYYLLRKSVTVPAHHFLTAGFEASKEHVKGKLAAAVAVALGTGPAPEAGP